MKLFSVRGQYVLVIKSGPLHSFHPTTHWKSKMPALSSGKQTMSWSNMLLPSSRELPDQNGGFNEKVMEVNRRFSYMICDVSCFRITVLSWQKRSTPMSSLSDSSNPRGIALTSVSPAFSMVLMFVRSSFETLVSNRCYLSAPNSFQVCWIICILG